MSSFLKSIGDFVYFCLLVNLSFSILRLLFWNVIHGTTLSETEAKVL